VAGCKGCVPLSPFVRQTLQPPLEPLDVHSAAGEELTPEAHVETGPADEVGHEGVAGDEAAAGQGDCESAEIEPVARARPSLREVALESSSETPLAVKLHRAEAVRRVRPAESSRKSASSGRSRRAADSRRCVSDSGTATAPRATAVLRVGSRSRKAGFRFTIPLR
jgi:hypothetical protein